MFLYYVILCRIILCFIILYYITYCILFYSIILYYIVLYYIILYHIILYYIILYYIILYYVILYYIVLHCIIHVHTHPSFSILFYCQMFVTQFEFTKLGAARHAFSLRPQPGGTLSYDPKWGRLQSLCWLMMIGDSTAQYIGDYNNPMGECQ